MVADSKATWYGIVATYKAKHAGVTRKRHLRERLTFVVRAADADEARIVAESVARDKEHEYVAAGGDTVRWEFREIEDIVSILDEEFRDGTEVYWQFFEKVDKAHPV